jgi:meso-butanediol dehydrogenase / (S,S)-butanediol dehydrogenase / diacetyl reductase
MTDEFRGKVAIVTGGGAGIGLAAAGRLAQEGASVVICSDREDQALQRPADCEKRASKSGG